MLSENFYWRGKEEGTYRALRELPKVTLNAGTTIKQSGGKWFITADISNPTGYPALMVRLKAVRDLTGDRILPAFYSDNFVPVMPGEKRTLTIELRDADTRGERPRIEIEGFNVKQ